MVMFTGYQSTFAPDGRLANGENNVHTAICSPQLLKKDIQTGISSVVNVLNDRT